MKIANVSKNQMKFRYESFLSIDRTLADRLTNKLENANCSTDGMRMVDIGIGKNWEKKFDKQTDR